MYNFLAKIINFASLEKTLTSSAQIAFARMLVTMWEVNGHYTGDVTWCMHGQKAYRNFKVLSTSHNG